MHIIPFSGDLRTEPADLIIVPVTEGLKRFTGNSATLDKALGGMLSDLMTQDRIEGKDRESTSMHPLGKISATKVALLGAGKKSFGTKSARHYGARVATLARANKAKSIIVLLPETLDAPLANICEALTEGAMLGDYRFLKYKNEELKKYADASSDRLAIATPGGKKDLISAEKGIQNGTRYAQATILARGLVNEPASSMTPTHLVDVAKAIAAGHPKRLSITVLEEPALKEMGMGGLLAVARSSDEPCYLIHLVYKPVKKAKKRIVVVGKGITFDSGGLSIKSADGMEDMKIDMAGAASMLAIMSALPDLAPDIEVHGITGVCENMPSGKAVKPGDVVHTMLGKTIEILNTDAEGRVTLADTLHYATTLKPHAIIDLATLTGACMVALGEEVAGVMSNNAKLVKRVLDSATEEGELMWEMPLTEEYRPMTKSKVADLKNTPGTRYGGTMVAGLFLQEFVGDVPWAHIDMAGPAWAERDSVPHQPLGATGFGVRTVLRLLENL